MKFIRPAIITLIFVGGACRGAAINIVLDYSYDSFFASHATAKATLEAAAQDLSSALTSSLAATTDTSSGTFHTAMTTFNFDFTYKDPTKDPALPPSQTLDPAVLPANQIKIYVGTYNLGGNTLGIGGPGGVGVGGSYTYTNQSDLPTSVQMANVAANSNMGRGSGPLLNQLSGSFPNQPNTSFTINYGESLGNLTFDVDSNNDGVTDSDAMLNSYWQFDYKSAVGPSQTDFYSVALHEMMHALGFGTSLSWNSLISSPHNWLGSQVISLEGTGANVLSTDNEHVAEGLLSTRLSDGATQEAVMNPTLTTGTRRTLTRLDLAFLRDIGWQTIAYPLLAGDFNQDNRRTVADIQAMMAALSDVSGYKTLHGFTNAQMLTLGDLNGDGVFSNRDLQSLIGLVANTTGGTGSLQMVPEPGSLLLVISGGLWLLVWVRSKGRKSARGNR